MTQSHFRASFPWTFCLWFPPCSRSSISGANVKGLSPLWGGPDATGLRSTWLRFWEAWGGAGQSFGQQLTVVGAWRGGLAAVDRPEGFGRGTL